MGTRPTVPPWDLPNGHKANSATVESSQWARSKASSALCEPCKYVPVSVTQVLPCSCESQALWRDCLAMASLATPKSSHSVQRGQLLFGRLARLCCTSSSQGGRKTIGSQAHAQCKQLGLRTMWTNNALLFGFVAPGNLLEPRGLVISRVRFKPRSLCCCFVGVIPAPACMRRRANSATVGSSQWAPSKASSALHGTDLPEHHAALENMCL